MSVKIADSASRCSSIWSDIVVNELEDDGRGFPPCILQLRLPAVVVSRHDLQYASSYEGARFA